MPTGKKTLTKNANKNKTEVKNATKKPEEFEEQRSTALRMKPQPLGKSATVKNKK